MHQRLLYLFSLVFCGMVPLSGWAQYGATPGQPYPVESYLNQLLTTYPFSPDNRFKIAAYAELKGLFSDAPQGIYMQFGGLGELSVYQRNCLLKLPSGRVFHLDPLRSSPEEAAIMNNQLTALFDQVVLLGNHSATEDHIRFVDENLSRKNLEPFYKLFVRHILIKYGRYDRQFDRVEFDTNWLPEQYYAESGPEGDLVRKHVTRLILKLDRTILRGYYIESGGTVYVEDVKRKVFYATGEQYDYNITAFKLFAQNLFVQTAQTMAGQEEKRLSVLSQDGALVQDLVAANPTLSNTVRIAPAVEKKVEYIRPNPNRTVMLSENVVKEVQPLYHPDAWIPLMLGDLRSRRVSIADPEVLPWLINQPFFPKLYQFLTPDERKAVDRSPHRKNSF